jgi:hypothetical protein
MKMCREHLEMSMGHLEAFGLSSLMAKTPVEAIDRIGAGGFEPIVYVQTRVAKSYLSLIGDTGPGGAEVHPIAPMACPVCAIVAMCCPNDTEGCVLNDWTKLAAMECAAYAVTSGLLDPALARHPEEGNPSLPTRNHQSN